MGKPTPKQPPDPATPRRRGCRRRAGCLALLLLVGALLVLGAYLGANAVRRSQWLADLILAEIQSATGLETSADSIVLEWGGETTVEGLTLRVPNIDEPLLTVERTTLDHDPLYRVALTRSLGLRTVAVESPVLHAEQLTEADGAQGAWSAQLALEQLLASLPAGGSNAAPTIPAVTVTGGSLVIDPAGGDPVTVPFTLTSTPRGSLGLDFALDAPGLAAAQGNAAAGAGWRHTAHLTASPDAARWRELAVALGLGQIDTPALDATWTGRLTPNGLSGALRLDTARAGSYGASGSLRLTAADAIRVEPSDIDLTAPQIPATRISQGRVTLRGPIAVLDGVEVTAADQTALIDGTLDLDRLEAHADVTFRGTTPGALAHHGHASLELRTPAGRPVITGFMEAAGRSEARAFRAVANLDLSGVSWTEFDIALDFPKLDVTIDDTPADLSGLTIAARTERDVVEILEIRLPNTDRSSVRGKLTLGTLAWGLEADLQRWQPDPRTPPLDLTARLRGVERRIDDWSLTLSDQRAQLAGTGRLDPAAPEPLFAEFRMHLRQAPAPGGAPAPAAFDPLLPHNFTANLDGAFTLRGTLDPLQLAGAVELTSTGLLVGDAPIQDIAVAGDAAVTADGIRFDVEPFDLLAGRAGVVARSDWLGNLTADATLEQVDLEAVATLLGLDAPLRGTVNAAVTARAEAGDLDHLTASGTWAGSVLTLGPVPADTGEGKLEYADGIIIIDETTLRRADGVIEARATIPLADLSRVDAVAEAVAYPVEAGGFGAHVTGTATGRLDVVAQLADVEVFGGADITFDDSPVATINAEGLVEGRTLRFDTLSGTLGEGGLRGSANLPLDDLTLTTADLEITALPPAALAGVLPPVSEIRGQARGHVSIAPAEDPHAQAPSLLRVALDLEGGGWRTIAINRVALEAHVGPGQSVLDRATISAAGGEVQLWGSTNLHNGERYVQVAGQAQRIDLAQVVGAVAPEAGEIEGRVGARFGGGGYLSDQHRMFGNAIVTVSDSDLIDIPLISQLYSVLAVGSGEGQRRGAGAAEVMLEGESLRIPRAQYSSRGTQVRLSLEIADIFRPDTTGIAGVAVGIARPLSGADTTITGSADRLLAAAQEGGTAVRIGGTLASPRATVVPLAELQNLVSRIFAPLSE